ncbi:MAG: hypothetical protein LUI10_01420 [Lachnospiraceae bacterium]|nr:hypothetical protein [Lachnospiraceae bacterium]
MKKAMALFLSLLLLMSLAACGSSGTASSGTDDGSNDAVVEDSTSSEDGNEAEDESSTDDAESEDADDTSDTDTESQDAEISFEELVVVDNDECVITITGIDADNIWGYTLNALFENKSSDKTYMFSVESASINGVMCDPFFASEVAAGKKSNEEISFYDTDTLAENGVTEYTDIEMTFRVYDSDDWSADDVVYETIHIYPYGEENATTFERETLDTDTVLVDNEYVTVIVTGYEHDDIWGYTANLFLVNKTDSVAIYSVDNASVNGFMIDPFYADTVAAGKCAFSSMSWYDEDLEDNGITDVEEIEFELTVYDYGDWLGDNYVEDVFTLNP